MNALHALRADAEALARAMPRLRVAVDASEATHVGSAGRRRAGAGEHFWQYRQHVHEDGSGRIDWRRSARGDTLYVRETELETARTFLFWVDPNAGFDWTGDPGRITKANQGRILALTMAILLSREGERVGILGGRPPGFGTKAVDKFGEDLIRLDAHFPPPPKRAGAAIIISDFYDPISVWSERLSQLAVTCRIGVMLAIADPVEASFPFYGRVRFSRPGTLEQRLLGRAEKIRTDYHDRFRDHRSALQNLAAKLGWQFLTHTTDRPALTAATTLRAAIEQLETVQ